MHGALARAEMLSWRRQSIGPGSLDHQLFDKIKRCGERRNIR
jgi:hypothetical protein